MPVRTVKRLAEVVFASLFRSLFGLQQQQFALNTQEFGEAPAFFVAFR